MKKQIASPIPSREAGRQRYLRRTGVSRRVLLPYRSRSASLKASVPAPTEKVEARLTGNDVVLPLDGKPQGIARRRFSSHTHAVEFSRTDAVESGQGKGLCRRKRPPIRRATKEVVSESSEGLLVAGTFHCLPRGRPKECTRAAFGVKQARRAGRSDASPPARACPRGRTERGRARRPQPRRASPRPGRSAAAPRSSRARRPTR